MTPDFFIENEIWRYLPGPDLIALCQTSKAFNEICSDQQVWVHLLRKDYGVYPLSKEYKQVYRILNNASAIKASLDAAKRFFTDLKLKPLFDRLADKSIKYNIFLHGNDISMRYQTGPFRVDVMQFFESSVLEPYFEVDVRYEGQDFIYSVELADLLELMDLMDQTTGDISEDLRKIKGYVSEDRRIREDIPWGYSVRIFREE